MKGKRAWVPRARDLKYGDWLVFADARLLVSTRMHTKGYGGKIKANLLGELSSQE